MRRRRGAVYILMSYVLVLILCMLGFKFLFDSSWKEELGRYNLYIVHHVLLNLHYKCLSSSALILTLIRYTHTYVYTFATYTCYYRSKLMFLFLKVAINNLNRRSSLLVFSKYRYLPPT